MSVEVPFEGPCSNGIYLVGEAPGEKEVLFGKPFAGTAGSMLNQLLLRNGIIREQCRLGNVMRVRPPSNDFSTFYLDGERRTSPSPALIEGRTYLLADIQRTKPKVVVPMGNEPLEALLGLRGITQRRGSIYWSDQLQCKVIPTIHPAAILRQYEWKPLVYFDLHKAKVEAKTPYLPHNKVLHTGCSFEEYMRVLMRMNQGTAVISFDIETLSDDEGPPYMTAIAFANSALEGWSIPFTGDDGSPWWGEGEEYAILQMVKELLENPRVPKVAQNSQFDMSVLLAIYGIRVAGLVMDTMIAHHVCYPELPKSLAVMTSLYTSVPYYKELRHSHGEEFQRYNAMDAVVTLEVYHALLRELEEMGLTKYYNEVKHPLIGVLLGMQERGVLIDEEARERAKTEIGIKVGQLQVELEKEAGRVVNARSPVDIKRLVVEQGLSVPIRKGSPTTNADALSALLARHPNRALSLVLEIRQVASQLSNHLEAPLRNGRMHTSYNIGGRLKAVGDDEVKSAPETGRISSSQSIAYQSGANLQNVPDGVSRAQFIPDPPRIFLSADLMQAEARFVAYDSEEARLISTFEGGGDPYIGMASWIFARAEASITSDERYLAKRMVLALNYGMGPVTFAMHLRRSVEEARTLCDRYFNAFPRIRQWQYRIQKEVENKWYLTTPLGAKRQFFGRWGDELFREAYAHRPQSTIGDLVNIALVRCDKRMREERIDAQIVLQVHDQYVVQCLPEDVERVAAIVEWSFQIPVMIGGVERYFPNEFKVGRNWHELEKWKRGAALPNFKESGGSGRETTQAVRQAGEEL